MTSSTNTVIIAASFSLALISIGHLLPSSSKPSPSSTSSEVEKEINPEDCIKPEDIIAVFDTLFTQMQKVLGQISTQIQQMQMSGQNIPETQLRILLKAEFERALVAQQIIVFEEHDMDEESLRDATWSFLRHSNEYPKVKRAVERYQKLYETITGEKIVGRRPGDLNEDKRNDNVHCSDVPIISKETLLSAATVYFDALTSAMSSVVKEFQKQGLSLSDKVVAEKLNIEFASKANNVGEVALDKIGVTLDGFEAAIQKYSQDRDVGQKLAMLQMKQQQEFIAMGIPSL
jgi:hypothetical protein